uniref:Uncharacterized protein n=1 Tax=Oryza sativa subsp. japonica TaxID=39947 RepID=Q6YTK9_ORYSJ|nr:hypothetical protein [Oryza sativa Japonica Group]
MREDAQKGDEVGVQVKQRKAVEIQDKKKKLGRRRKKTARNIIFDYNHAAQDGFRFCTSSLPLHGPVTGEGTVVLQLLHGRGVRGRLLKVHHRRRIAGEQDEGSELGFFFCGEWRGQGALERRRVFWQTDFKWIPKIPLNKHASDGAYSKERREIAAGKFWVRCVR